MNFLPRRLLSTLPSSSRTYSSFFSSNSGNGGRYFNSSKPGKAVVTNTQRTTPSNSEASEAGNDASATVQPGRGVNTPASASKGAQESTTLTPTPTSVVASFGTLSPQHHHHPVVDTRDLKLLQFFTLHRPLLLLSNPTSIFHTPSPSAPLFFTPEERAKLASQPPFTPDTIESSHEADAEAARQLSRAMTMNHAGAAHTWEQTLHRLGLDVSKEPARVGLQEQMEKEWQDVMMDSVKRKRRKKMKKHKLKKRRRATRAQRLKLR